MKNSDLKKLRRAKEMISSKIGYRIDKFHNADCEEVNSILKLHHRALMLEPFEIQDFEYTPLGIE